MNERVAAVQWKDQGVDKNLRPTEPGASRIAGAADTRFAYASGSRPLEGYTIKRGVGHGGFGEVYFATSDAGKEVGLKLIRRNFDVELRGIRHCLNLKHPNLLAIFDIREDNKDDKWVVMEYITGQRLDEVVAAHPDGMPADQVLMWMHGMGAGVAYLHDHGIVHRDLKPGNIFSDEGMVKIGDYGLSKFISCSRRSGQTESIGTVHYMAPEVANGRYGKEIDIYALGVILYEMLTGRVPFEGESVGEVLMKHLTAKPDVSTLPEPYRSVVARALDKDPAKRFGSVAEMLACLPGPATAPSHAGPWLAGMSPPDAAGTAQGAMPAPSPVPMAEMVDEEPIARAVRQFFGKIQLAWNDSKLDPTTKTVLLVLIVCAGVITVGAWFIPALVLLGVYGSYWLVRSLVLSIWPPKSRRQRYFSVNYEPALSSDSPDSPATAEANGAGGQTDAPAARHGRFRRRRHPALPRWARRERPADVLVLKPARERVAELFGSLLGGVLVSVTMTVMMVILNSFYSGVVMPPQAWVWFMLVSTVGTWAVLIPSKFWEGRRGEAVVRRFVLLVMGLSVGAFAAAMGSFLKVGLPYGDEILGLNHSLSAALYDQHGHPLAMAYLACFGTLFPVIRWWRQANPLRRTRLSLWSVFWCVAIACVVAALWQFPQAWLMMVACAVSVSVQLSSPWLNVRRRHARGNH
ncbi:MAG: serine/threonine-protein kinase [Planctomycetota bacterium]|jgi:hypothetical protein